MSDWSPKDITTLVSIGMLVVVILVEIGYMGYMWYQLRKLK